MDPLGSNDLDPQETREWLDALEGVLEREGTERAHFLIEQLIDRARRSGAYVPFSANTAYINTIPVEQQARFPGDFAIEHADPALRALERDGDGRPREQAHQRRRPHRELRLGRHALRRRLQPLLAIGDGGARRRSRLPPGTLVAGHLRPRVPARPAHRGAARRTSARRWTGRASRRTRTRGSCRSSGSSPRCRWASGRSWPSTRRGS